MIHRDRTYKLFSTVTSLAVLLLGTLPALAQPRPMPFQKGDTVCIIGDSITHGGKYPSFLYLYYVTRFPDQPIKMFNCGISGDSAGGAVRRLEWDILIHKPTAATVLLGMNDVGRTLYGRNKTDEKSKKAQESAIRAYAANMTKLMEALAKAKVRTTVLTPTIYEQNADTGTENLFGCDEGLFNCGLAAAKIAQRFRFPTIDVHDAMDTVNTQQQRRDRKFTVVGKDRVHPGEPGHLVVAHAILKGQQAPQYVSKVVINANTGTLREVWNCRLSNFQATREGASFESLERALPFPVSSAAAPALAWVPFQEDLNQELLRIDGLMPGMYELRIDGQLVGECNEEVLAAGVNLATLPKTPQYQQAEQVAALNAKRQALESGRLRTFAAVRHGYLSQAKIDTTDEAAVKQFLLQRVEKAKGSPYYQYSKGTVENYLKYKPDEKSILAEVELTTAAMYEAAKPKPHRFVVTKKG
jgi:endoglucanase